MRIISLFFMMILISSCSTSQKELGTSQYDTRIEDGGIKVNFFDKTSYYLTVNKAYLVLLPVRKHHEEYYLVDNNCQVILNKKLSDMPFSQGGMYFFPPCAKKRFIQKGESFSYVFDSWDSGYIIVIMNPFYISINETYTGATLPLQQSARPRTLLDYMQKLEYYNQNIYISGYYDMRSLNLKYYSYMAVDR